MRSFSFSDRVISELDAALRAITPPKQRACTRASPADSLAETLLTAEEKRHIASLMRVNHSGEVCAQALYQGQALTARLPEVREQMNGASLEEIDHLAWCEQRLQELEAQPSKLNILWYSGSLAIGMLAGWAGDAWSLGFVAETERQVHAHLQKHLHSIPTYDQKTQAILTQMQQDEAHHANVAQAAGAKELPFFMKRAMRLLSLVMTKTSYYI